MNIKGINWHAVVADEENYAATRAFFGVLLGVRPKWEADGFTAFHTRDGASLELLAPAHVPDYGLNGGVAFGFLVDDVEEASATVVAAGGTLVGDVVRTGAIAYRHFTAPDGRTYGLTELTS